MRRSGQSGAALVVLAGLFVAVVLHPTGWRGTAAARDRLDTEWRRADELNAFNRQIAAELTARRIGLADAADRVVEANADRPAYFASLQAGFAAPTAREGVARSLVHRAEHPLAPGATPAELPALRAEYAALFARPYAPPRP